MLFSSLNNISIPSWISPILIVVEAFLVIVVVHYRYRDRLPRYYRRLVNKNCLLPEPEEDFWSNVRPIRATHYAIAENGVFAKSEICLGFRPRKVTKGNLITLDAVIGEAGGPQTLKTFYFVVSKNWTLVEDRGFLIRDQRGGHLYIKPSIDGDVREFCQALKDAQEFKSSDSFAIKQLLTTLLEVVVGHGVPPQVTQWVNEYVGQRRYVTLGDNHSVSELDSSSSPREA